MPSQVWHGTIGTGTVFGIQIIISPDTFHITQPPCLADSIGTFFNQQYLVFLQVIQYLMSMTGEDDLRIVRIALAVNKQIKHCGNHIRMQVRLYLVNNDNTAMFQCR